MGDRDFLRRVVRLSLLVGVGGIFAAAGWYALVSALGAWLGVELHPFEFERILGPVGSLLTGTDPAGATVDPLWWIGFILATLLSLPAHELVHALFFRQFAPAGTRVAFGANWRLGMLFTSAENVFYTRRQYLIIAIAPTVVVTLVLLAIGFGMACPLWAILTSTIHLMGCTGDWCYAGAIHRDPSIVWCEDTDWGVAFWGEDKPEAGVDVRAVSSSGKGFSVVDGGRR